MTLLAWVIMIGLGLFARHLRRGSWAFEWLVWMFVVPFVYLLNVKH